MSNTEISSPSTNTRVNNNGSNSNHNTGSNNNGSNNNGNNNHMSYLSKTGNSIQSQVQNARLQLLQVCMRLRRSGTDGKDKVKAFETFVIIAKTLKHDLAQCFEREECVGNMESKQGNNSLPKRHFGSGNKMNNATEMEEALDTIPVTNMIEEESATYVPLTHDYMVKTLRFVLTHRSSYLRAAAVRSIRYCCKYVECFSSCFWKYHCHFLLCKMIDADKKNIKEKKQVFDLLRLLARNEKDATLIPPILVKAVVSIADNPEDTYKFAATEILRDLLLLNPKAVASSNGIRILFAAILNPKFKDISESILLTFLYLLDDRDKRKYIRSGYDIQFLLSPFTQGYVEDKKLMREQLDAAKKAICILMKSWTGLICLSEKGIGIDTIVNSLLLPEDEMRKDILFDTIIEILRGASPPHYHYLIPQLSTEGQEDKDDKISHLNVLKRSVTHFSSVPQTDKSSSGISPQGDNITMSYLAMCLQSFINSGLMNALLTLSKMKDQHNVSQRASQILQTTLALSDLLLSSDRCLQMHDLFDFVVAKDLRNDELYVADRKRSKILSMLTLYTQQTKRIYKKKDIPTELVKALHSVNTGMDDNQFNQLVKESNVMATKDDKKWNWERITTLVFGPLKIPSRLQEALNSKLIRRIFYFFLPSSKLFSDLAYKEDSIIYARVGEQLIENLLPTNSGYKFLSKCGFLDELRDILQIELQPNPESYPNRTFSEEKVTYRMAREYFTFIGKLSSFPQGVDLLQDFKIFSALHKLTTTRDDICQLIIKALDYTKSKNITKPARSILKQAMEKGSKKTRYFSTLRIRRLVRESVDFHTWGIELLANQLTDPWEEVAKNALKILAEACQETENLDALTSLRPAVETLEQQPDGRILLLRLVSRPNGFFYLYEVGWIQKTMKEWVEIKNVEFVVTVEEALDKAMNGQYSKTGFSYSIVSEEGVCLPPHFFGELCKTNEGCELLKEFGHFNTFEQTLAAYEKAGYGSMPSTGRTNDKMRQDSLLNLRAALWAIGQMGASDVGFQFIEEANCTERLIKIAETSQSLSLRGTCMYILGVMCKSSLAQEKMSRLGWECHVDPLSRISVCVPSDPTRFFTIPKYEYDGSAVNTQDPYFPLDHHLPDLLNENQKKIMKQIALLANPVTEAAATKALKKFKVTSACDFTPMLMYYTCSYLSKYRYSLRTKKLIFQDLFGNLIFSPEYFDELDATFIRKDVS